MLGHRRSETYRHCLTADEQLHHWSPTQMTDGADNILIRRSSSDSLTLMTLHLQISCFSLRCFLPFSGGMKFTQVDMWSWFRIHVFSWRLCVLSCVFSVSPLFSSLSFPLPLCMFVSLCLSVLFPPCFVLCALIISPVLFAPLSPHLSLVPSSVCRCFKPLVRGDVPCCLL